MGGAVVKNLPGSAGDARDAGSYSGLGRSSGVGNGNPLQYSCLENSMDRGAWQATVHGMAKSQTWLRDWAHTQMGEWHIVNKVTHWLLLFLWFHSLHSSDEVVWKVPSSPWLALLCMSSVCWNEHFKLTSVILLDCTLRSSHGDHTQFCSDFDSLSADTISSQCCTVSLLPWVELLLLAGLDPGTLPSFWRLLSHYWIPRNLLATHIMCNPEV